MNRNKERKIGIGAAEEKAKRESGKNTCGLGVLPLSRGFRYLRYQGIKPDVS